MILRLFVTFNLCLSFVPECLCLYHLNPGDNAIVWRNKQELLPKRWQTFVLHALRHCISVTCVEVQTVENIVEAFSACFHRKYVNKLKCERTEKRGWALKQDPALHTQHCIRNQRQGYWQLRAAPFGQDCVVVHYENDQQTILEVNQHPAVVSKKDRVDGLHFTFQTHPLLSLNITFGLFSLSDMCIVKPPKCILQKGTEYVIAQSNQGLLYFCMKRPEWSFFVGHYARMEYQFCQLCRNLQSVMAFTFQTQDTDSFTTFWDTYGKVFYLPHASSFACVSLKGRCVQNTLKSFIRGYKLTWIQLIKEKLSRGFGDNVRVLLLSDLNHNMVSLELRDTFLVKYFYCTLLIVWLPTHTTEHQLWKYDVGVTYRQQKADHGTIHVSSRSIQNLTIACCETIRCHKVFRAEGKFFLKIQVERMTFSGVKVFSCLYGGMTFLEGANSAEDVMSLCGNYSSSETMGDPHLEYTSTSHSVVIVIFHSSPQGGVFVNLSVSSSKCVGVFVNACISVSGRHLGSPHLVWPPEYENILEYDQTYLYKHRASCISIQLGLRFVFVVHDLSMHNSKFATGCQAHFK